MYDFIQYIYIYVWIKYTEWLYVVLRDMYLLIVNMWGKSLKCILKSLYFVINCYVIYINEKFFGNMINLKSKYLVLNRLIGNFITLFRLMAYYFGIKNWI